METNPELDDWNIPGKPTHKVLGRYRSARRAHDAGLAVLAAGRPYWVFPENQEFALVVPTRDAEWLAREVEALAVGHASRSSGGAPGPPLKPANRTSAVAVVVVLGLIFTAQSTSGSLTESGVNSSVSVLGNGEWWRLFTAITLHGDFGHLLGNSMALPVFGYLCSRYLGSGLAWLTILLLAGLANLTNVLLAGEEEFRSLGASTAVFAALGLLTGVPAGWYLRSRKPVRRTEWAVPFVGGCILFFWLGGGNYPTDIAGHLWAFTYGLIAALPLAYLLIGQRISRTAQRLLLAAAGLLVAGCWSLALLN